MTQIEHLPSRVVSVHGKEYLYFSGTSYLGIGMNQEFKKLFVASLEAYGTIYSASRNNNLTLSIYSAFEKYIANVNAAEDCVSVSSGLLAGQLVVKHLAEFEFIYAPSVHPAIWAESNFSSPFSDYLDFTARIIQVTQEKKRDIVICCNTIDPLMCIPYNFDWVNTLPKNKNIILLFDDSHALGLDSENLDGSFNHGVGNYKKINSFAGQNVKVIVVSSLAKALGIQGGIILASKNIIGNIRKSPLFAGASPIIPAYLETFLQSRDIYLEMNKQLKYNIAYFKQCCLDILHHFKYLDDYPIFYIDSKDLYTYLYQQDIIISSFSYPSPISPSITRIVLSSLHTKEDINMLSEKLHHFFNLM